MKFLAFILSIYIFALNLALCEDNVALDNIVNTEILQAIGDDHQNQDSDLCSPFCQCHCCHVHILDFGIASFNPFQDTILKENFSHFDSLGKDIHYSLLQPPKIQFSFL